MATEHLAEPSRTPERLTALWARQLPGYLLAQASPLLAGLVGLFLLPRLLGQRGYGTYAVALATATAAGAWLGNWLVPAGLRLAPDAGPGLRDLWVALGQLSMLAGLAAAAIAAALSARFGAVALVLSSALAGLTVTAQPLVAHLRAQMRAGVLALWAAATSMGSLVIGVGLVLATGQPTAVLGGGALSALAGTILYMLRTRWVRGPHGAASAWWGPVLRFGLPIAATGIGGQFLLLGDRYLLAALKGPAAAGVYAAAYGVAERAVGLPFAVLFGALYPLGAAAWAEGDRPAAGALLRAAARVVGVLAGAAVAFQAASGVWLTRLVAGPGFEPPASVPVLVSAGTWLWYLAILQHQPLEWEKRTALITGLTFAAALLNLALNLVLIPAHGPGGAAAATVGAYAAYLAVVTLVVRRVFRQPRAWPAGPLLAAMVSASAAAALRGGTAGPLAGATAAVTYLALAWALRGWSPQEVLRLLRQSARRTP